MIDEQNCLNVNFNATIWDICDTDMTDRACACAGTGTSYPFCGPEHNKFHARSVARSWNQPGCDCGSTLRWWWLKDYSGIASFTSSQSVEVVLLRMHKPAVNLTFTQEHFNPSFDDGKFAASLIKQFTDAKFNAGLFVFAGNALAFRNLEGKAIVITYTING